jgi:hypothetical protein
MCDRRSPSLRLWNGSATTSSPASFVYHFIEWYVCVLAPLAAAALRLLAVHSVHRSHRGAPSSRLASLVTDQSGRAALTLEVLAPGDSYSLVSRVSRTSSRAAPFRASGLTPAPSALSVATPSLRSVDGHETGLCAGRSLRADRRAWLVGWPLLDALSLAPKGAREGASESA